MENSLHYLGESLNHVMQFQQNVNRNMVEHLNMTAKNQLLQGQALGQLVENTRQREFDKLFDSIPVYDGEDPEKFEPWLSKLESACLVGKRDVREVAICSSTGPVLEVLNKRKRPGFPRIYVCRTNKYGVNTPYSQGSTVWSKVNWTDK